MVKKAVPKSARPFFTISDKSASELLNDLGSAAAILAEEEEKVEQGQTGCKEALDVVTKDPSEFLHCAIKVKLKVAAFDVMAKELLRDELQAMQLISSGKGIPEHVTKITLIKVIAFLCYKLDWIEKDEHTLESECEAGMVSSRAILPAKDKGLAAEISDQ